MAPRDLHSSGQPQKPFHPPEERGGASIAAGFRCVARLIELGAPRSRQRPRSVRPPADPRSRAPEQIRIELEDDGVAAAQDGGGPRLAGQQRHLAEVAAASIVATCRRSGSSTTATAARADHEHRLPWHRPAGRWPRRRRTGASRSRPRSRGAAPRSSARTNRRRASTRLALDAASSPASELRPFALVADLDRPRNLDAVPRERVVDRGPHLVARRARRARNRSIQNRAR